MALETVDSVVAIPLQLIEAGDRMRPVDPVWAGALGRIMTADGGYNRTPIEVCRLPGRTTFLLVAGGHRLEGARLEGWATIRAIVVSPDQLARRQAEISENLFHSGLTPLDRARAVAELVHLKKLQAGVDPNMKPQSIAAQARWADQLKAEAEDASLTVRVAYGFTDEVADQLQLSKPTIYRDLELHRRLMPDVAAKLRATDVAGNAGQLRALAKLSEADQRKAVQLILEGRAKGAAEAIGILHPSPKPAPADKHFNAFVGAYARMGARDRRNALRELQKLGLPSGVTLTFKGDDDA